MSNRLEAILETVTQIVSEEILTGEAARKKVGKKLPTKAEIKKMKEKAKREKEIKQLERLNSDKKEED